MSTERIKKRNRKILVCGNCHKKKRRCDRQLPCTSCVSLSIDDTCSYSTPSSKRPNLSTQYNFPLTTQSATASNTLEVNTQNVDSTIHKRIDSLNQKIQELEAALTVSALQNDRSSYNIETNNRGIDNGKRHITQSSNGDLVEIKESMLLIGINPVDSTEDEINFLDNFHKSPNDEKKVPMTGFGPLRFLILAKRDPFTKLMTSYLTSSSLKKFSYDNTGVISQLEVNDLELLNKKSQDHFGKSYIKKLGKPFSRGEVIEVKNAVSEFGLSIGTCFLNETFSFNTDLLVQIKKVLPTRKILNMLLDIFFDSLYPYFPIFDELSFRSEICQLLGEGSNIADEIDKERIEIINVKGNHDTAILASLLVMIRLSYLSLFSNDVSKNTEALISIESSSDIQDKKYLLQHPVPLETIYVAESCINEYGMTSQPSFVLFQALLMLHLYKAYAPEEDSFGKYESTVHIGNLYQVANSLLLNRDPEYCYNYFDKNVDEGSKLLKRKIWYHLITIDIEDSLLYGTPIFTSNTNYDTSLPSIPPNISISNLSLETKIVDAIRELHPIVKSLHSILEIIFRVKSDIKVSYLTKLLSEFETLIHKRSFKVADLLNDDDSKPFFFRVKEFKLYIQSKLMLLYIYYGFYIYYEHKTNTRNSFFYLKKVIAIIFLELGIISEKVLKQCEEKFGTVFNLIMSPTLLAYARMQTLMMLIALRVVCTRKLIVQKNHSTSIEGYQVALYDNSLKNILDLFDKIVEDNLQFICTFKNRYFYGWKLQKTHIYGLALIEDEALFNEEYLPTAGFKFSLEEFIEMENLLSMCTALSDIAPKRFSVRLGEKSTYTQSDHNQMYDFQIDKLWMLLELFKQEDQWGRNAFLLAKDSKYSVKDPMEGSNTLDSIDLENILPQNDLYSQLSVEDFIFDFNPYSNMGFHH